MNLSGTQLKDTYGNLVTTGTSAGSPTTGGLQNGDGALLTSIGIGTNSPTNTLSVFSSGASAITIVDVVGGSSGAGVLQLSAGTTLGSASFDIVQNSAGAFLNQRDNKLMSFYVNNDEKIRIEADGDIAFYDDANNQGLFWDASTARLGLGTQTPDYKLEVESSSDADLLQVKSTASANNTVLRLGISGDDAVISGSGGSTGNLAFKTYGSERMRIGSGGDISFRDGSNSEAFYWDASEAFLGIGTVPATPLHVNATNANACIINVTGTSPNYIFDIRDDNVSQFRVDSSGNTSIYSGVLNLGSDSVASSLNCIGDVFNIGVDSDGNSGGSPSMRFNVSGSEKMRIDSSGNAILNTDTSTTSKGISIANLAGTSGWTFGNGIIANSHQFVIYDNTAGNSRLLIDSSGNVGIGTTSPANGVSGLHIAVASSTDQLYLERTGSATGRYYLGAAANSFFIVDDAQSAERLRIDSSGNMGLGVTPSAVDSLIRAFEINGGSLYSYSGGNLGLAQNAFFDGAWKYKTTAGASLYYQASSAHNWSIAPSGTAGDAITFTSAMTLDASGNLLVGKTSADDFSSAGAQIESGGQITTSVAGAPSLRLNRGTNDGDIIELNKGGTTVGRIGTYLGNLHIGTTNGSDSFLGFRSNVIVPAGADGTDRDDVIDLGYSGARFDDIYATNGTIQTSDINEKQDIEELDDAELRVAQKAKTLLRKFRWKSSVEEKGDDARIHFGIIAQDLEQAFTDEGLDAGRYAMFIKSTWTNEDGEEQTRLGVRYNQLLAFIISAI